MASVCTFSWSSLVCPCRSIDCQHLAYKPGASCATKQNTLSETAPGQDSRIGRNGNSNTGVETSGTYFGLLIAAFLLQLALLVHVLLVGVL